MQNETQPEINSETEMAPEAHLNVHSDVAPAADTLKSQQIEKTEILHSQSMKSEADYQEGAHGTIGEEARRSRLEAEEFQKKTAH